MVARSGDILLLLDSNGRRGDVEGLLDPCRRVVEKLSDGRSKFFLLDSNGRRGDVEGLLDPCGTLVGPL